MAYTGAAEHWEERKLSRVMLDSKSAEQQLWTVLTANGIHQYRNALVSWHGLDFIQEWFVTCFYYISQLVRAVWLVNFARFFSLYCPLNMEVSFPARPINQRDITNILITNIVSLVRTVSYGPSFFPGEKLGLFLTEWTSNSVSKRCAVWSRTLWFHRQDGKLEKQGLYSILMREGLQSNLCLNYYSLITVTMRYKQIRNRNKRKVVFRKISFKQSHFSI